MKYVVLSDNTRIDNCTDNTTSNFICAIRKSYEEAGSVRDLFTAANANVIRVYNDDDTLSVTGANLILVDGCKISENNGNYICEISTRIKTDVEKMQEEISELQDAILEIV